MLLGSPPDMVHGIPSHRSCRSHAQGHIFGLSSVRDIIQQTAIKNNRFFLCFKNVLYISEKFDKIKHKEDTAPSKFTRNGLRSGRRHPPEISRATVTFRRPDEKHMEIWDIYDRGGRPTGRTVSRRCSILRRGEYHLVVHIWITDGRGNTLIQRRSDSRPFMPGVWAATGGAAVSGEGSSLAAARELREELGIQKAPEELKLLRRITRRNSFVDVYFTRAAVRVDRLSLQREEVAEARWVSAESLKRMIIKGSFHDYGREYFETVFAELKKEQVKANEQAT